MDDSDDLDQIVAEDLERLNQYAQRDGLNSENSNGDITISEDSRT
jgi:hypothetical protein